MKPLNDLERLINRIVSGLAIPRDLVALRSSLEPIQRIIALTAEGMAPVTELIPRLYPLDEIAAILAAGLADEPPATLMNTGIIRKGYSAELDQVYFESTHAREWMANLESSERERTGIKNLKVSYNKVFGYYIEVSKGNVDMVPDNYIRKQTLVNGERFITPEMKEYESLVLNAEERIREIESQLFRQLCSDIGCYATEVLSTARGLAMLDVLLALAETAVVNNYVKPEIHEGLEIEIMEGRHPVVEKTMQAGSRYVSNDTIMTQDAFIQIITGPNMSGKSTYLRQIALIILMAQMGSFVPARSARIGLVDRIFTRIGAQDEIHAGLSTFMVEMVEAANILNNAGPRSLLILDEIGRGTSTYDGLSIAWAILEYIHNSPTLRSRTLFATHYHELTVLPDTLPGMRNYNVAVTESDGNVVFLHKIIDGAADRSYGIHVAQIAGLPKPVISRANELMKRFEGDSELRLEVQEAPLVQLTLFPETNPIIDALRSIDVNSMSPIEAINQLYEWQKRFVGKSGKAAATKKRSDSEES
jgi:DNA mismatch repair protein MutS